MMAFLILMRKRMKKIRALQARLETMQLIITRRKKTKMMTMKTMLTINPMILTKTKSIALGSRAST